MTTLDIPFWTPTPSGGISSLLRNSVAHPSLTSIDTINVPKVGVLVDGDTVVVSIADGQELGNTKWFHRTVGSLVELLSQREEPGPFSVSRIQPKAVERMLELLTSILDPDTAPPSAVPTSQGGVQVEWHQGGVDLEIEVTASGKIEYFFGGPRGDSEGSVEGDTAVLRQYTQHLKVA